MKGITMGIDQDSGNLGFWVYARCYVPFGDKKVVCQKRMLDGQIFQFLGQYDYNSSIKENSPVFVDEEDNGIIIDKWKLQDEEF